jgi:peptidase E
MKRQIIALGGGGFSDEPDNPLLDNYILSQSAKPEPKICFIPTASGDAREYIDKFYRCFEKKNCAPTHLSLFSGNVDRLEEFILERDIVFVGGGNTRNLLILWKEWGLDQFLRNAYARGIILSGISAGSICWFEQGLTDSFPNQLHPIDCLGILEGSNCPHFDSEPERKPIFMQKISAGELKGGLGCEDGVALHFINEQLHRAVSSDPEKRAYGYESKGSLTETVIEPEFLPLHPK